MTQETHSPKKNINDLNPVEAARISYHMQLFGLDPATQFKGALVVPADKPKTLEYESKTTGVHALSTPHSIEHAKEALGIPDSTYSGANTYNRFSGLNMVSPEKDKKELSVNDITQMHQAARGYIFGNSSHFAHFKTAINKHLIDKLEAVVFVYAQLDLHSDLKLVGNGKPIVLIVHTLNIHPGGSISTDDSPICMNVTEFNHVGESSKAAANTTIYDVVIDLGTASNGADGANGAGGVNQPKANNGKNGKTECCSSGTKPGAGDPGQPGGNGLPGNNGMPGGSIPEATFFVRTLNCNVSVVAKGGNGGKGGLAGNGGKGGDGGNGGTGNGTAAGGAGGRGGDGGTGGNGGDGGNGGNICLYVDDMTTKIFDAQTNAGIGGVGGDGGEFGANGDGGTGNPRGNNGTPGQPGKSGKSGNTGAQGQIIIRKSDISTIDGFTPNSGPAAGGTKVTILGNNFYKDSTGASVMEFRINNKPMTSVNIISTLQAEALTPENDATSAFPIVVINKDTMASAASAQNFVYTE